MESKDVLKDELLALLSRNRSSPPRPPWLPQDMPSPLDPGEEGSAGVSFLQGEIGLVDVAALPSELHLSNLKLATLPRGFGESMAVLNWDVINVLSLASNELRALPDALGCLRNLHTLWLDHNKLEQVQTEALAPSLVDLSLHDNAELQSIPFGVVDQRCPKLECLRVDRCPLLGQVSVQALPRSLKLLHLEGCMGLLQDSALGGDGECGLGRSGSDAVAQANDHSDGDGGKQARLAKLLVAELPQLEDLQLPVGAVHFKGDSAEEIRQQVHVHYGGNGDRD